MIDFQKQADIPIQKIESLSKNEVDVFIKREDLIHPFISGNKFRKLKYNVFEFNNGNYDSILTFGGAFSNHISAVATLTKELNIPTIGIIRGEEIEDKINENPTLKYAQECGMNLIFINRDKYRNKHSQEFLSDLKSKYGNIYILPEGGTNELAVKGCSEILNKNTEDYNFICCPIGTAGTISGIIKASKSRQAILGFPALKQTAWIQNEIEKYTSKKNYQIINQYHFGGYAKYDTDLITFVNDFKRQNQISLEPIYTGKMAYGLNDLIKKNYFPNGSKILMIHTGGLQGIDGFNNKLNRKGLKLI